MHIKRIQPKDRITFLPTILTASHILTFGESFAPHGIKLTRSDTNKLNITTALRERAVVFALFDDFR